MILSIDFRAMNTAVVLAAEGPEAWRGLQAAKAYIEQGEQRFSRFRPDSELSRLNHSGGQWQAVSKDLFELLRLCRRYQALTGGLFDPAILGDLKRAGYDRSLEQVWQRQPAQRGSMTAVGFRPGLQCLDLDPVGQRARLRAGLELDLGGIAKGWIVRGAAEALSRFSPTCAVSAGGDMLFVGRPESGSWDAYLEDPRDPEQLLAHLQVAGGAVVTSSITKRTWMLSGQLQHHLIDPRTGRSAVTDWLSVTVLGPDILEAEACAKALLLGGPREREALLRRCPQISYLAVDRQGGLVGSAAVKEYFHGNPSLASLSLVSPA